MKVMHFTRGYSGLRQMGGVGKYIEMIVTGLHTENFEFYGASWLKIGKPIAESCNINFYCLTEERYRKIPAALWIPKLLRLLQNLRPDILHTHGGWATYIGGCAARLIRIPVVATFHNTALSYDDALLRQKDILLDRLGACFAKRVIAVSNAVRKDMIAMKIPDYKIQVIHNGINVNNFASNIDCSMKRIELGLQDSDFIIGTVGNLLHAKGHEYLIYAAKHVISVMPNAKFLIIGEGGLRQSLESLRDNLGLTNYVVFTGMRSDIHELLNLMNIFVLPSVREGLPFALLEAMASRKPIIASRVGGIPEIIIDNQTGLLVNPRDPIALAQSIIRLLKDPSLAINFADNAYRWVSINLSIKSMIKKIKEVYTKIINR